MLGRAAFATDDFSRADSLLARITDATAAVKEMADELGAADFQADELARALTALGKLLVAYDNAITKVAEKVSEKASGTMTPSSAAILRHSRFCAAAVTNMADDCVPPGKRRCDSRKEAGR
jgi:hypothetical protein